MMECWGVTFVERSSLQLLKTCDVKYATRGHFDDRFKRCAERELISSLNALIFAQAVPISNAYYSNSQRCQVNSFTVPQRASPNEPKFDVVLNPVKEGGQGGRVRT